MATVRNLTIKIGSDLTGLQRGLATAAKDLNKWGSQMVNAGQTFTKSFTAPILAAGAAIGALAFKAAGYGDKMTTLSSQTGMSVQKLQELEYIAGQSDTSFEAMTGSMSKFTMKLKEAMDPASKTAQIMDTLGISMTDQNGAMKSREQLFMEAIQATGGLTDETTQSMVASELFGRSFAELLPLMKLGADGIKKLSDRYKSLGIAMSDEQIASLDAFSDKSEEMKLRVQKAFYLMAANSSASFATMASFAENTLIPAIQNIIEKIAQLVQAFGDMDPKAQKFILWEIGIVAALGPAMTLFGNLSKAIGGISTAMSTLFGWLGKVVPLLGGMLGLGLQAASMPLILSGSSSQKVSDWKNANPTQSEKDALAGFTKKVMGYKTWEQSISGGNSFTELAKQNVTEGATSGAESVDSYIEKMASAAEKMANRLKSIFGGDGTEGSITEGMKDFASSIRQVIDAIKSQTDAWANFAGMFDIFERKYISGDRLMKRMQAQVKAIGDWQQALVTIQSKGVSEVFLNALRMQGPGAVDSIMALARMSPDQLKQYEGMYNQKYGIAGTQAMWANQANTVQGNQINISINAEKVTRIEDVDWMANQIVSRLRLQGVIA